MGTKLAVVGLSLALGTCASAAGGGSLATTPELEPNDRDTTAPYAPEAYPFGLTLASLIFDDGFESGDYLDWSAQMPTMAGDDALALTNGSTSHAELLANDGGVPPLTALSFGGSVEAVGSYPADGVTVGSFPAPGGGTLDATLDAGGTLTVTANGTAGTGTVTLYYEMQASVPGTSVAGVEVGFGDFPTAVDDSLATLGTGNEYTTEAGVTLSVGAAGGVLSNDVRGNPTAQLTTWGGGDASGSVDRNPGTSTPFAGGTLTVDADGSFAVATPTVPGPFTFDYVIENPFGSSQATVEVYVADPPVAAGDLLDAPVDQDTSYPAATLFADNGQGADYLGAPPATVASFGGGTFGGYYGDYPAGSTVAIPVFDGTLTVRSDGSLAVDTPTLTGSFTFDYQLDNGVGTAVATVTVEVVPAPIADP